MEDFVCIIEKCFQCLCMKLQNLFAIKVDFRRSFMSTRQLLTTIYYIVTHKLMILSITKLTTQICKFNK